MNITELEMQLKNHKKLGTRDFISEAMLNQIFCFMRGGDELGQNIRKAKTSRIEDICNNRPIDREHNDLSD